MGDIDACKSVSGSKKVDEVRIVRHVEVLKTYAGIDSSGEVVAVELLEFGVLRDVDMAYAGVGDVKDGEQGVVCDAEAADRCGIDGNLPQVRASRGVEGVQVVATPGIEGHHRRIVREVETLVEVVDLSEVEDGEVVLWGAHLQRFDIEGVVVEVECLKRSERGEVKAFELVVAEVEDGQVAEPLNVNLAEHASVCVDNLDVFGIAVDAYHAFSRNVEGDGRSGPFFILCIIGCRDDFMLFGAESAVDINVFALGNAADGHLYAVAFAVGVVSRCPECCNQRLCALSHASQ